MTVQHLDLEKYRTPGSKVFTGRDRGEQVRIDSKFDSLVNNSDQVEVLIPADIRSINPSFLEEFLINTVKTLGERRFREKVKFINQGRYQVDTDLCDAVDRILRIENALA